MSIVEDQTSTQLEEYQERVASSRARFDTIVSWHLKALTEAGIEPPYNPAEVYISLTVQEWNSEAQTYEVDIEATRANLGKVARFASKQPDVTIEKKYDSDFSLDIKIAKGITLHYYANRETVCTKKVVGTKVVPAHTTPERIEEVVEWDCNPVSLLAGD